MTALRPRPSGEGTRISALHNESPTRHSLHQQELPVEPKSSTDIWIRVLLDQLHQKSRLSLVESIPPTPEQEHPTARFQLPGLTSEEPFVDQIVQCPIRQPVEVFSLITHL